MGYFGVRDTYPGGVSFVAAGNAHDRCYYTIGSDPNTCNEQFLNALIHECKETFTGDLRVFDPRYKACLATAALMYSVVKTFQSSVFGDAQDQQRSYLDYVAQVVANAQAVQTFARIVPVINLLLDE